MICEKCGGTLSLEDQYCPHCGQVNEHAQQHIHDMEKYKGAFETTRKDVYRETKKFTGITIRAIVLAALLVLVVVCAVIMGNSYSFHRSAVLSRTSRNAQNIIQNVEQYIADEDYYALAKYNEANYIASSDAEVFDKYEPVLRASTQYAGAYDYIMSTVEAKRKDRETAVYISSIGDTLNWFYKNMDLEQYEYQEGAVCPENKETLQKMKDKIDVLLITYFHLTPEDIKALEGYTPAKRVVLLEERLNNEK